jgi:aerobic-type carbon monoxide dehydrogenase small subunit (CoxS/CutS family)
MSGSSRREFLKGVSVTAIGAAALGRVGIPELRAQDPAAPALERLAASGANLELVLNGEKKTIACEPRTTLLDLLRQKAGFTGAKEVCDRGACGACTVIVDKKPVVACMLLAHDCAGKTVETIEGLGSPESPHPIQRELAACDGLQCGFCTPGMAMSLKALLDTTKTPSLDEIRHAVSGNVCRCGTYPRIFEAAQKASAALAGGGK